MKAKVFRIYLQYGGDGSADLDGVAVATVLRGNSAAGEEFTPPQSHTRTPRAYPLTAASAFRLRYLIRGGDLVCTDSEVFAGLVLLTYAPAHLATVGYLLRRAMQVGSNLRREDPRESAHLVLNAEINQARETAARLNRQPRSAQ